MKTEYLIHRELEHVFAALTPSNRIACEVSLHTGLRISDVLAIRADQLKRRFTVVESKTKKRRTVTLTDGLLADMRRISGRIYVFEHRLDENKHKTRQAVYADVKRAARAFRIPQNIAPHSFRKVYAAELFRKYGDIEKVKKNLNHSSVAVTYLYAMSDKLLESKRQIKKK